MKRISIINLEINRWNGLSFTLLGGWFVIKHRHFEGELIGLHFGDDFLIVNILFKRFEIIKNDC